MCITNVMLTVENYTNRESLEKIDASANLTDAKSKLNI